LQASEIQCRRQKIANVQTFSVPLPPGWTGLHTGPGSPLSLSGFPFNPAIWLGTTSLSETVTQFGQEHRLTRLFDGNSKLTGLSYGTILTSWLDLRRAFGIVERHKRFVEPDDGITSERKRGVEGARKYLICWANGLDGDRTLHG